MNGSEKPTHIFSQKKSPINISAIEYNSREAREEIGRRCDLETKDFGLVVSYSNPWHGFSPDGVIFEADKPAALLEIKCASKTIQEAIKEVSFLDVSANNINLERKHKYNGHIQASTAILNLKLCYFVVMPRTYHRKSQRQDWNNENMTNAIEEVTKRGMPYKTASRIFQVPLMSLKRRVKNKNKFATGSIKHLGSMTTTFTADQENELINHVLDFEIRMYGLTAIDLRRLAFQLAERNNIPHKFSRLKQIAGYDWLKGFKNRHPEIALRAPEATSAARAMGFNKQVVTKFYDLLKSILVKHTFTPHRCFNVDETSISTVPGKNSKIFAKRGRKQVARITSAERGVSATAVVCTSAGGVFVPPMVIFCRKRMKAELMDGAPPGTIFGCKKAELMDGAPPGTIFGCNDSGWMKLDLFEQWFDHFLTFTKPTKEEPVLLILDGRFVRAMPLDVGVMYPLSTYMDQSLEKWMNNNPGRTVTTFQISKIFSEAYLKASVPSNAINGFKKAGIVPFNPDIFSDAEFAAAEVTEEPYEAARETIQNNAESLRETIQNNAESLRTSGEKPPSPSSPIAGPSTRPDTPPILKNSTSEQSNVEVESSFTVSPADCRPVPKITG
ncbi:DDE superfamily endonuclease [Popillia japonica]|uniref:DDE superfamily endonuclease n=1 Tax=Popillia japonica TaxID=7064 RepID=A0AAW1L4J6_POPJA